MKEMDLIYYLLISKYIMRSQKSHLIIDLVSELQYSRMELCILDNLIEYLSEGVLDL